MKKVIFQFRTAFVATLILATIFTACQKDVEDVKNPTIEQVSNENIQTLSVSMVGASDDADYLNVFFNESAAVYRISKKETAKIQMLNAAKENRVPIVVEYGSDENNTILNVSSASIEATEAFKISLKEAMPAQALEEDLTRSSNLDTRANDIVPNLATLNQIFQTLYNMSVVLPTGFTNRTTLNIPGYTLGRVPFQYAVDGCYARAHAMRKVIESNYGYTSYKRFIFARLPNTGLTVKAAAWGNSGCCIPWAWHVAPALKVRLANGTLVWYVLDPSIFNAPVPAETWDNSMIGNLATACKNNAAYVNTYQRYTIDSRYYQPASYVNGTQYFGFDNNYTLTYSKMAAYRTLRSCPKSGLN
jgi:Glutaminase